MSKSAQRTFAWRGPTLGWAAIVILLATILTLNVVLIGPLRFIVVMSLTALMLTALALGLVGVSHEKSLQRLIGGAGFFFIFILFLLTFVDLLTRLR